MSSRIRKRESYELLKIMLDGNWYGTKYLQLAAGKFIPPERASRIKGIGHPTTAEAAVERGRARMIYGSLKAWLHKGKLENRHDDKGVEWHLKDTQWAKRMMHLYSRRVTITPGEPSISAPPITPLPTPQSEVNITLSLPIYNSLLEAKHAYESSKDGFIDWGAFLLLLLGFALGGKIIKERFESNETSRCPGGNSQS